MALRLDDEQVAVKIQMAIFRLSEGERRVVVENLRPGVKRIVLSLNPDLWPTPGECPDGC